MLIELKAFVKTLSSSNAAIKNTASPIPVEGWFPAFSATGQDVWLDNYRYDCRAIIVSAVGARCGKCFKADGKWNICANTHILQVNESFALRDYIFYLLNNEKWWVKGGTAQPFVKVEESLKRRIDLPTIEEQARRTRILDSIVMQIQQSKQSLSLIDEQVKSLFNEMFGDQSANKKWPTCKLGDYILFMTSGSRGWAQYVTPAGKRFITIKNVKNTKVFFDEETFVTPPSGQEGVRTKVQEGDVLISITADLGRTGVVTREIAEFGGYINQHLALVRVDRNRLLPVYVAHCLESDDCKLQFGSEGRGGTKLGLNFAQVKNLRISLPPLAIQQSFINKCAEIDKLRFKYQRQIELLNELMEKKMEEYFGGDENA